MSILEQALVAIGCLTVSVITCLLFFAGAITLAELWKTKRGRRAH